MELYEQIRQEYERGAGTIRAVARKFGVHRREVQPAAPGLPQQSRAARATRTVYLPLREPRS